MRVYYILLVAAATLLFRSEAASAISVSGQTKSTSIASGNQVQPINGHAAGNAKRFLRFHKMADDDYDDDENEEISSEEEEEEEEERGKLVKFTKAERNALLNENTMWAAFPKWFGKYSPSTIWDKLSLDKAKNQKYRDIYDKFKVYSRDKGH
ncbi:hypothetical protein PHYBOEH_011249 [Phytophthora boehmeriae]|uniref:RxLR effector protein n=1 Tax=Phytophthora boehmeriae TaxID=109152 RepID=A0A8T1WYJ8_9STRA|nr:hypothetical protein PHYBOEH_011249 [Phytophthora boehmeriae]